MDEQIVSLAVQAGGAGIVCGMFLLYLHRQKVADDLARKEKQEADNEARQAFMEHLEAKDKLAQEASDKQLAYLQTRDAQSKEIALSGHAGLREVADQVRGLRDEIQQQVVPRLNK